jgi:hypothetical protein
MRPAVLIVASLASLASLVVGATGTAAQAQNLRPPPMVGPIIGPPTVTWLGATGAGDASGSDGSGGRGASTLEPIRLGLMADAPATGASPGPCESNDARSFEPSTSPITPFQSAYGIRLVPRLTLFAFSRGGCAFDGALGGAFVFVQPLAQKVSLVMSAGSIYLPHYGLHGAPAVAAQARADVVFQRPAGRSLSVGIATPRVGSVGGSPRLTFGGIF